MDSFATAASIALQHGVPLKVLCEKFAHSRFEPSGWTGNEHIGYAKSIMDYIFRWLQLRFLSGQQLSLFAGLAPAASPRLAEGARHAIVCPETSRCPPEQHASTRGMGSASAPQGGIAPEPAPGSRLPAPGWFSGRPRPLPPLRRHAQHVRHGRRPQLPYLRSHHGKKRKLLPMHELRQHQRLLGGSPNHRWRTNK